MFTGKGLPWSPHMSAVWLSPEVFLSLKFRVMTTSTQGMAAFMDEGKEQWPDSDTAARPSTQTWHASLPIPS